MPTVTAFNVRGLSPYSLENLNRIWRPPSETRSRNRKVPWTTVGTGNALAPIFVRVGSPAGLVAQVPIHVGLSRAGATPEKQASAAAVAIHLVGPFIGAHPRGIYALLAAIAFYWTGLAVRAQDPRGITALGPTARRASTPRSSAGKEVIIEQGGNCKPNLSAPGSV